jgi:hypothetical protein
MMTGMRVATLNLWCRHGDWPARRRVLADGWDRRIDYILVRCEAQGPTLRVDRCEQLFAEPVAGVWASDHLGVVADLSPRPSRT